ncbi:MAG: amidohydrolase family protein, partial [Steroidobacteraceae bacterium]
LSAAPVIKRVVQAFGAERVMWGSDVAQSPGSYAELLALAKSAVAELTSAEQSAVLYDTCKQVYSRR